MTDPAADTRMQLEFCVPEAQRLADLYGMADDLKRAIRYSDLHIEIDPTEGGLSGEERSRREDTRQALCRAALVSYSRAFSSGVRTSLNADFVVRLSPGSQHLHRMVKDLRDKWVAHPVNHFDDVRVRVSVRVDAEGYLHVEGTSITAHQVGGFVRAWMQQFRALCAEALALVEADSRAETERVKSAASVMTQEQMRTLTRVDGVPMDWDSLQPARARSRFKSSGGLP